MLLLWKMPASYGFGEILGVLVLAKAICGLTRKTQPPEARRRGSTSTVLRL